MKKTAFLLFIIIITTINSASSQLFKTTLTTSLLSPPEKNTNGIKRIAVLDFDNISSKEFKEAGVDVGSKMADYLTIQLLKEFRGMGNNCFIEGGKTNIYSIIEREEIKRVLKSKNIVLSNLNESEILTLGKELGVDAILAGNLSYSSTDERNITRYTTKDGVVKVTHHLTRTTSLEVRMKIFSIASGEFIGQKSARSSYKDSSSSKTPPKSNAVKSSSKLAEFGCERVAYSLSNYIAPYYYSNTFTFERVKNKKFKQRIKDATEYLKLKELDKAYQMYSAIYEVDPYNAELVFNMGILNEVVGNYSKAKELYGVAVNMDASNDAYVKGLSRTKDNIELTKYLKEIGIELKLHVFETSDNKNLLIERIKIKGSRSKRKVAYQEPNEKSSKIGEFPGSMEFDLLEITADEKWILVKLPDGKKAYFKSKDIKRGY